MLHGGRMYRDKYNEINSIYKNIGREIVKKTYVYLHAHKELLEDSKYRKAYCFARKVEAEYDAIRNDNTVNEELFENSDFIAELYIKTHREELESYRKNADWLADELE